MPEPPKVRIVITPAGYLVLVSLILGFILLGLGLREYFPDWFRATSRNDDRHLYVMIPFLTLPLVLYAAALMGQRWGYPLFRLEKKE